MSTGTTEPGFDWQGEEDKSLICPKIGETIVGDKNNKY
jgi:hypothetical protein